MTLTKGRIGRVGEVCFGDASLAVWEDGLGRCSTCKERDAWERLFKREVFSRVVQTLNRLGWVCVIPQDMVDRCGRRFALSYRHCTKGDLQADLELAGRTIKLQMYQDLYTPGRKDGLGKYEFNKESLMPYLMRLEMERTRRRIATYLCNVFTGYTLTGKRPERGANGLTALEWVKLEVRQCWHYQADIDRRGGEEMEYNNRSAYGSTVIHGERVWFFDAKGRLGTGIAHYNINNMWWVITGKYGLQNIASFHLYTSTPGQPRVKRNEQLREKRLRQEMGNAIKALQFERAALLRDLLYPAGVMEAVA